jgi:argininosuccinate lyase
MASRFALEDLTLEDLKTYDERFTNKALTAVLPLASANARVSRGGTGTLAVTEQLERARALLGGAG